MSRPPYEPTEKDRATVHSMAGYGIQQDEIARVIGVDPKTLRKHFREQLDLAATQANAAVAQSLFKKATGTGTGSVIAAIFWMKARAGWADRAYLKISVDPETMTDAELVKIAAAKAPDEE